MRERPIESTSPECSVGQVRFSPHPLVVRPDAWYPSVGIEPLARLGMGRESLSWVITRRVMVMNDPGTLPPLPPLPVISSSRIIFFGHRSDFRHLAIRGGLLELVTVGFYRFWLATDIRRHLWSNTVVGDDVPEYTGTAKELLIGFLFALAILTPIYLVYFLVGLEAERLMAFASIPLGLFFY